MYNNNILLSQIGQELLFWQIVLMTFECQYVFDDIFSQIKYEKMRWKQCASHVLEYV